MFLDNKGSSGALVQIIVTLAVFTIIFTFGSSFYLTSMSKAQVMDMTTRKRVKVPAIYVFTSEDGDIEAWQPVENRLVEFGGDNIQLDVQEVHTSLDGWGFQANIKDTGYFWDAKDNVVGEDNLLVCRSDIGTVYFYFTELRTKLQSKGSILCEVYENNWSDKKGEEQKIVGEAELVLTKDKPPMESVNQNYGFKDIVFGVITLNIPLVPPSITYPISAVFYLLLGVVGFLIFIKVTPMLGG